MRTSAPHQSSVGKNRRHRPCFGRCGPYGYVGWDSGREARRPGSRRSGFPFRRSPPALCAGELFETPNAGRTAHPPKTSALRDFWGSRGAKVYPFLFAAVLPGGRKYSADFVLVLECRQNTGKLTFSPVKVPLRAEGDMNPDFPGPKSAMSAATMRRGGTGSAQRESGTVFCEPLIPL